MDLLESFIAHVREKQLFSSKDRLLLAVSGGVDSVVLCYLCHRAGMDFIIAHCNFQLRGEESTRDENFVIQLGEKYGARVVVQKFDTSDYALSHKCSIQEAARELRYEWFEKLLFPEEGFSTLNYILTAHHGDDNAETVLMNFCRGTGLHGLTGIPESPGYIRRPLLPFSKQELIAYAKANDLGFVEDSSNLSGKYTRNFFRNEIIPAISKFYPNVLQNLQDNIRRFKSIEALFQLGVEQIRKKLLKQKGKETHIPVKQLMEYESPALLYELFHPYGFQEKQLADIEKLAWSESGKYLQSPDKKYHLIKHRHWFILSPVRSTEVSNILINEGELSVPFELGILKLDYESKPEPGSNNDTACLDARNITFPLLLRKWKAGDYFYPLGMRKKKKIGRFFIDQKLSRSQKERAWVLEMDNKIIWVVGYRIDDRYKVTASTTRTLTLHLIDDHRTE